MKKSNEIVKFVRLLRIEKLIRPKSNKFIGYDSNNFLSWIEISRNDWTNDEKKFYKRWSWRELNVGRIKCQLGYVKKVNY